MLRNVYLTADVCRQGCLEIIAQLEMMDELSNDDIYLYVSSYGGDCFGIFGVMDCIKRLRSNVVTIALGKVMSAGAFIITQGTKGKRLASLNTRIMIHEPRMYVDAYDVSPVLEYCKELQEDNMAIACGITQEELEQTLTRDTYMSSSEAKEQGFIDAIVVY